MNFDFEIKKCLVEKDIHALTSAVFEQKKIVLEAKKRVFDGESRVLELMTQVEKKQAELASLEE